MALLSVLSSFETPENGHEENVGEYILHHVSNSNEWNIFGYHLHLPQLKYCTPDERTDPGIYVWKKSLPVLRMACFFLKLT